MCSRSSRHHRQQISSDRFYTGGLSTGEPARLGAQLASPGQNRFRIGEIDIADPDGSGAPMLFPELLYWRSVGYSPASCPRTSMPPASPSRSSRRNQPIVGAASRKASAVRAGWRLRQAVHRPSRDSIRGATPERSSAVARFPSGWESRWAPAGRGARSLFATRPIPSPGR